MALVQISEACPKLLSLEIQVDMSIGAIPSPSAIRFPFSRLQSLNFGLSKPPNPCPVQLALFLDGIFGGRPVTVTSGVQSSYAWGVKASNEVELEAEGIADRWRGVSDCVEALRGVLHPLRQQSSAFETRYAGSE